MLVLCILSVHAEFSVVIWKNVRFGTEGKIVAARKHSLSSLNILPHQVFAAKLKALRKMVYLLKFRSILQLFRFTHCCPKHIPFRTIWWHNSYSSCFHGVDNGVINMCTIMHFESQCHILVHHFKLMNKFYI